MTKKSVRFGLALGVAMLGAAACSSKKTPMDSGLQRDLAAVGGKSDLDLAPNKSVSPNLVISAEEAGPTAAPEPATHRVVPKPSVKPTTRVATKTAPAPQRMPDPVIIAPTPAPTPAPTSAAHEPAPREVEPAPLPAAAPSRSREQQKGVYKTEGEIFQQMPWIRP